jgi:hypothetical protein
MPAPNATKERLLAAVPPDRRVALARALDNYNPEADDPTLTLLAEVLERLDKVESTTPTLITSAIRGEHAEQRRTLHAIYHPQTWKRLLVSKALGLIIAPVILALAMLWGLENISSKQLKVISTFTPDTARLMAFTEQMKTAAGLAKEANKNAEALLAIAALLNHPNVEVTRAGNDLRISGDLRIEQKDGKPTLLIGGDGLRTIFYSHQLDERRKEGR